MVCSNCNGKKYLVKCRNYTVWCDECCPHDKGRFDMQLNYGKHHKNSYYCVLCGVVFVNQTSNEKCRCEECCTDFSKWAEISK